MKLSLRWIFDHIDADYKKVDVQNLVDKFNKITAEIEGYEKFELNLSDFALVKVKSFDDFGVLVSCSELRTELELQARKDINIGDIYLIKKCDYEKKCLNKKCEDKEPFAIENLDKECVSQQYMGQKNAYSWAKVSDFGCQKDGLVPAIYLPEEQLDGSWKKTFEDFDYIIEVDNKSITHRPDMWGHRGFAREVAAILGLKFKKEDEFLKKIDVQEVAFEKDVQESKDENGFKVEVANKDICKRFSGLYMPEIKNRPSSLWMACRLMRINSRPIDFIVDATNYVMNDISQPMHAFDVAKLKDKAISARLAKSGEKLELLDESQLELSQKDYVITDGKKPIALAGVMGGKNSGIEKGTNSIFVESANFLAASVRNSAIRAKNRTDASARFEKTLDPNQNILGIFRLLKLFEQENINYNSSQKIISIGKLVEPKKVVISHEYIERLIGAKIKPEFILDTLEKLDFEVKKAGYDSASEKGSGKDFTKENCRECESEKRSGKDLLGACLGEGNASLNIYEILVPTFRCSKDIEIKEDIVEEIGRFFGYENTDFILPKKLTTPYDLQSVLRARYIKKVISFGLQMREVRNYAFYDESFLNKINWAPSEFKQVTNPVSDNWSKLVTSLVPHLIKNIDQNFVHHDKLRFFEYARTWNLDSNCELGVNEKRVFAGIFYDKVQLDFYTIKNTISSVFDLLNLNVIWEKAPKEYIESAPWFFAPQTAQIVCDGKVIGYAGMLDQLFYNKLFDGNLFAFELDGEFLVDYKPAENKLEQISRYPEVSRDVSMFVPLNITVDTLQKLIINCSEKIKSVQLLDFFQKDGWKDKKSLTFRFIVQDYSKTLDKEEVDLIYNKVVQELVNIGAQLR